MTLVKRLLRTRLFKVVVAVLVLTLAWQVFLTIQAPGKVDPALQAQVEQGDQPVRIAVTLDFPPERFHTLFLQDYGRVIRVDGNSVHLRDVRPSSVRLLARVYWIDALFPLEDS